MESVTFNDVQTGIGIGKKQIAEKSEMDSVVIGVGRPAANVVAGEMMVQVCVYRMQVGNPHHELGAEERTGDGVQLGTEGGMHLLLGLHAERVPRGMVHLA